MNVLVSGLFSAADSYGGGTATIEIIIMLLVAFILGYLLRYLLSGSGKDNDCKKKYDDLQHQYSLLEEQSNIYKIENRKLIDKNNQLLVSEKELSADNNDDLIQENNKLKTENKNLLIEIEKCKGDTKLGFTDASKPVEPAKKDNLKKIEGIGPKIEQMIFAKGIYTWEALSKTEVSIIQEILDAGGPNYRVHDPASWPFQAKLAAEGKWDELKKWQDDHKHGKF